MSDNLKCDLCQFWKLQCEYWWKTTTVMWFGFGMFIVGAIVGYWLKGGGV